MKLIAETAMHHEGDFNYMKSLVKEIVENNISDFVKIHLLCDINEYFHIDHPGYETTKSWLFSNAQWDEVIRLIYEYNKEPIFLYNDIKSVELGSKYNPKIVEVHSVCLNDFKLLKALKKNIINETKVIFGVGGSSLAEIDNALNILDHSNMILMFGFQNYPTNYSDINFAKMRKVMRMYPDAEYGYADHTAWDHPDNILITLFGASMGIDYIEKHVTISHGKQRADWNSAISIAMMLELNSKLNLLLECNGDGSLELNSGEMKYSVYGPMKKAPILTRDVNKGDNFSYDDFDFKRTSQITDLSQVDALSHIGSKYSCNLSKGTCINSKCLEK